jgi:Flp pilus assembly pilin Flp
LSNFTNGASGHCRQVPNFKARPSYADGLLCRRNILRFNQLQHEEDLANLPPWRFRKAAGADSAGEGTEMVRLFKEFFCDQKGLTMIEYALIAALIATTLITALTNMGATLKTCYTTVNTTLSTA